MTLCTSCKNNDVCIVTNMDAIRGDCIYYTPKTNADRIREMSDEELAEIFCRAETDGRAYGPRGKAYWLKWLRSPAGGECK